MPSHQQHSHYGYQLASENSYTIRVTNEFPFRFLRDLKKEDLFKSTALNLEPYMGLLSQPQWPWGNRQARMLAEKDALINELREKNDALAKQATDAHRFIDAQIAKSPRIFKGDSRDPQYWDPFMVSFPYYSHITPIRIPKDMGIVWETYHKGVPSLGVPENILEISSADPRSAYDMIISS